MLRLSKPVRSTARPGTRARAAQVSVQKRNIITNEANKLLSKTPWYPPICANLQFQMLAACEKNADEMQDGLLADLYKQGCISVPAPQMVPAPVLGEAGGAAASDAVRRVLAKYAQTVHDKAPAIVYRSEDNPSAARLAELCKLHGPLRVKMTGTLPETQGANMYPGFHAFLLVSTFQSGTGRTIGLVVDGNDQARNEIMKAANELAAEKYGGADRLSRLTTEDMSEIQARLRSRSDLPEGEEPQLQQAFFRFVDLDEMVGHAAGAWQQRKDNPPMDTAGSMGWTESDLERPASQAPRIADWNPDPNSVRYPANVTVKQECLPYDLAPELGRLCAQPGLVEHFPPDKSSL